MNPKETKVMSGTNNDINGHTIYIGQSPLEEEVDNFSYLGALAESDGNSSKEIGCRLSLSIAALKGMKNLWQDQDKETKLRLLRAFVFPVATYACETSVMRKTDEIKITALENKRYLMMSVVDPATNKREHQK